MHGRIPGNIHYRISHMRKYLNRYVNEIFIVARLVCNRFLFHFSHSRCVVLFDAFILILIPCPCRMFNCMVAMRKIVFGEQRVPIWFSMYWIRIIHIIQLYWAMLAMLCYKTWIYNKLDQRREEPVLWWYSRNYLLRNDGQNWASNQLFVHNFVASWFQNSPLTSRLNEALIKWSMPWHR